MKVVIKFYRIRDTDKAHAVSGKRRSMLQILKTRLSRQ